MPLAPYTLPDSIDGPHLGFGVVGWKGVCEEVRER